MKITLHTTSTTPTYHCKLDVSNILLLTKLQMQVYMINNHNNDNNNNNIQNNSNNNNNKKTTSKTSQLLMTELWQNFNCKFLG